MNEGFLYKLIFRKAMGDANEAFQNLSKKKLKTLWDRLGVGEPVAPYTDYFKTNDESAKQIWRMYEINEKNNRS